MGKRELLIIAAFVVIGIVAFQLTAAPPADAARGFSFSTLIGSLRREVRGNRATASATTQGTFESLDKVTELRVSNVAELTITGETRRDVAYDMQVESNGPDEQTARGAAARTNLVEDRLGSALRLRPATLRNVRQVVRLKLRVPSRLALILEGAASGTKVSASNLAAVQMDAIVGDAELKQVAGPISGTHRNGDLRIVDADSVKLTLQSSKATLQRVRGAIVLSARNGRTEILEPAGRTELDAANQEVMLMNPDGAVVIRGSGGRVRVTDPRNPVSIDTRRTTIDVTIARAIPLTILTADAPLRLFLIGTPDITIDAIVSEGGSIDASDYSLVSATAEQETRLSHTFGTGRVAVALRNQRAAIVIGRTK